ncbi:MAG: integration host factor subunit beta [Alphaproteobacteria bacterium]|nr:integration host factor subunit beta [Alphaproteobacteria bacterium]OJV46960.1 MAG: integration host factor subunit beta [Alphaproteobacteria bacterium 43-37]
MNKSDIISNLARAYTQVSNEVIEKFVNIFVQQLADAMSKGKRVELRGFGAFSVRRRDSRVGRNPRTGAQVEVGQKHVPFFRMGKPLQQRMNAKTH